MNRHRLLLLAVGAALCLAPVLHAQHPFAPIPGPSGGVTTTWSGGYNLGTAPAGTYSSYLIITNWGPSTALNDQWSNEARASLHGSPLDAAPGTGTGGPANSGTIHIATPGAATGSASNINAVTNMFWFGSLSSPFVSTGANNLFLSHRQTFNSAGDVTWQNMRVVLDPNVTNNRTVNGIAAPAAFTDLGTLQVGNTNLTFAVDNPNTGAAGFNWYRFQVDANVDASTAFDIFTTPGATGTLDTRLTLFRNSATGLIPVASTDDMSGTLHAGLTFGSSDDTAFLRDTYDAISPGWFNGRGGTLALVNLNGLGYFSGVPGAATLSDSLEYFLAVSHFSGTAPTAPLTGGGTLLDLDELGVTLTGTVNIGLGNPGTAMGDGNVTLNFRSIPEPTSLALLAAAMSGGAFFVRRRRQRRSRK
ncbi:MAG TPA: PEP-CTERM sorting domain-containing protein [Gemmatales bacterium]|nr:PEP-CTERM sorting domain-containing protein [Gemmatales bacterium]